MIFDTHPAQPKRSMFHSLFCLYSAFISLISWLLFIGLALDIFYVLWIKLDTDLELTLLYFGGGIFKELDETFNFESASFVKMRLNKISEKRDRISSQRRKSDQLIVHLRISFISELLGRLALVPVTHTFRTIRYTINLLVDCYKNCNFS